VLAEFQQLQDKLSEDFYVDNLYVMSGLCKALALNSEYPVPFFVLRQVFLGIAKDWEDRPLTVEEAKSTEHKIRASITHLIKAIKLDASSETIYNILNDIVSVYLTIVHPL
jgi:hypothetical protein